MTALTTPSEILIDDKKDSDLALQAEHLSALKPTHNADTPHIISVSLRQWQARLDLSFAYGQGKTHIVKNAHKGPLRVLKPFYPEGECCHTYLIHPPGGLVLGDELVIGIKAFSGAQALITTPSAGKVYGVAQAAEQQRQSVNLTGAAGSCIEWLPQETLIFNGANTILRTQADLTGDAKLAMWDIVCFGRPASALDFNTGRCEQAITVKRDGIPLLIERNVVHGGGALQQSAWGLQGLNSIGTFIVTVDTTRELRQTFTEELLASLGNEHQWGLTQKGALFIARYLGSNAAICRKGFEQLWQQLRPKYLNKKAIAPRIWAT